MVEVYKYLKLIGYDYDNSGNLYPNVEKHKRWDRDNFSIYVRSAAKLLRAFDGNADKAKVYLVAKAHEYKEKDISDWTLNAVAKCAVDFTNKGDNVNDAGRDDSALDRRLGRRDNMVKVAFDGSNGNDIPGTRTIAHEGTGEGSEEVIYSVELPR